MELKQLQHFLIVAQELSFTKAAEKAYVSQQALSKSVRMLENELEVALFERLPRGLALTSCGQFLLKRGYKISALVNDTITDIHNISEERDVNIPIAITDGVEDTFPVSVLFQFQKDYPEYRISTILNSDRAIEEMLVSERIELGLTGAHGDTGRLKFYPLIKSGTRVIVHKSNPLSKRDAVSLEELRNERFLFSSSDFYSNSQFLTVCNVLGFSPNIYHQSSGIGFQLRLAEENQGIILCPDTVEKKLSSPELCVLRIKDDPCFFHIHLAVKKNHALSEGAERLKTYILDAIEAQYGAQR